MLDRVNGEIIGNLGKNFVIAPISKWADTPMWEEACERATASFVKKGAVLPISFDEQHVLIQEYLDRGRLAFIFARKVASNWVYVPVVMVLAPDTLSYLKVTGRWPFEGTIH